LDELDILGFDYDYTLASYTDKVSYFIYDKALQYLLRNHGYTPSSLHLSFTLMRRLHELTLPLRFTQLSPRAEAQDIRPNIRYSGPALRHQEGVHDEAGAFL
jgi:hypothetical protein